MAVLDLLQAAGSANPGLKFEFVESFVDRGGRAVGSVVSIDEVKADNRDQKWLVWVNSKFIGTELRRVIASATFPVSASGETGFARCSPLAGSRDTAHSIRKACSQP